MKLSEKLKARSCKRTQCKVDGELYEIKELTRRERGSLQAKCRSKSTGELNTDRLESELLSACVCDPEDSKPVFDSYKDWDGLPAAITGPLIAAVLRCNGFDEGEAVKD